MGHPVLRTTALCTSSTPAVSNRIPGSTQHSVYLQTPVSESTSFHASQSVGTVRFWAAPVSAHVPISARSSNHFFPHNCTFKYREHGCMQNECVYELYIGWTGHEGVQWARSGQPNGRELENLSAPREGTERTTRQTVHRESDGERAML